jgi:hypothetical protein
MLFPKDFILKSEDSDQGDSYAVAATVTDKTGRVLICQRRYIKPYFWLDNPISYYQRVS